MSERLTPQDALAYVMLTMAAIDSTITAEEFDRMRTIVRELPVFNGFAESRIASCAQECARLISEPGSFANVLSVVQDALPAHMHDTAYALAVEVAITDLEIGEAEERFLAMLARTLGLSRLTCDGIERSAKARHQRA